MALRAHAELNSSLPTADPGRRCSLALASCICASLAAVAPTFADDTASPKVVAPHEDKNEKLPADLSGHKKVGTASVYDQRFAGRKMANGEPMKPTGNNAASKTLPLGTTKPARVRWLKLRTGARISKVVSWTSLPARRRRSALIQKMGSLK